MTATHDATVVDAQIIADLRRDLGALAAQLTEERAQRAAMAEVLGVISAWTGDLSPIFDAILGRATSLCRPALGMMWTYDGEQFVPAAVHGPTPFVEFYRDQKRLPPVPGSGLSRHVLGEDIVKSDDIADEPLYKAGNARRRAFVELGGARSAVSLALRRGDKLVGAIQVYRQEVRSFSELETTLLSDFAAQAVIAIENAQLLGELRTRTAELAERNCEYGERIEQQSATIDVLKVMSASPGDPQPVFDLIVRRAQELCNSKAAGIYEYDGELVHLRSVYGAGDLAGASTYFAAFPMMPIRGSIACRAILDKQVVHIRDTGAEPGLAPTVRDLGIGSTLAIPMLRDGAAIGAFAINSMEIGGYSDSQVALSQTFAEQAVIAISNAETYRALQERTADLQESLEYQTATSDVLKVISRSTFDLRPVLVMVAETAARLCAADQAVIIRHDNGIIEMVANFGFPPEYEAVLKQLGPHRLVVDAPMVAHRAIAERRVVHIHDVAAVSGYAVEPIKLGQQRTSLGVPLLRAGEPIGSILLARRRVEPFTDRQIELVNTFADQAVIAIENTRLLTEQQEALEQQTATAEVLQVINASPGNLTPVFDAILEKAHRICHFDLGSLATYDGTFFRAVATRGYGDQAGIMARTPYRPLTAQRALLRGDRLVHIPDMQAYPVDADDTAIPAFVEASGFRASLMVPLRKDSTLLGFLTGYRNVAGPFSDKQITLLGGFAAQAVIAMENARLLTEQREALEQQTATAEVLQVINASPGNLAPVFDSMLEKAMRLCEGTIGGIFMFDGDHSVTSAVRGVTTAFKEYNDKYPMDRIEPGFLPARIIETRGPVQNSDLTTGEAYRAGHPYSRALVDLGGIRAVAAVPLLKDGVALGMIAIYRQEAGIFSDKQIALLENFAAQAVIAMESARLLQELRVRTDELAQRQAELRVTFENMGDGVAMFDEAQRLVAWNRKFQDILNLPDGVLAERLTFAEYIRYLTERGEYGTGADPDEQIRRFTGNSEQYRAYERVRPHGQVIEVRHNPVPSGGFVLIFSDITDRKRNEAGIRAARDAAEEAGRTIEAAYRDLKAAQANLIQAEKMASLGQLTAGIAHEIKNPLNFVNNFAALSVDLLSELKETAAPGFAALTDDQRAEIDDVSAMLTSNLEKITEHGKRADGIVKAMLEHSRGSSAERRLVDLNAVIDEALNLAYHGARAQDQSFNVTLERDFGEGIAPIEINPQDMTRVFLNIFSNGFYAANKRARNGEDAGFLPTLKVTTRDAGEAVEIHVQDNGTGIPPDIRDKLFQPFFTTKPTGEGTGLGLSITYDIVTQQHGGSIAVDSKIGEYSEFTIRLPRNP